MDATRAIAKIQKLTEKKKTDKILKFLKTDDIDVIIAVLDALSKIEDESSVNTIAHMIDSPEPRIRCATAKALGVIGTEYAKTYLSLRLSKETDETVITAIKDGLHAIADKKKAIS